jgi:hypothetical protein
MATKRSSNWFIPKSLKGVGQSSSASPLFLPKGVQEVKRLCNKVPPTYLVCNVLECPLHPSSRGLYYGSNTIFFTFPSENVICSPLRQTDSYLLLIHPFCIKLTHFALFYPFNSFLPVFFFISHFLSSNSFGFALLLLYFLKISSTVIFLAHDTLRDHVITGTCSQFIF